VGRKKPECRDMSERYASSVKDGQKYGRTELEMTKNDRVGV